MKVSKKVKNSVKSKPKKYTFTIKYHDGQRVIEESTEAVTPRKAIANIISRTIKRYGVFYFKNKPYFRPTKKLAIEAIISNQCGDSVRIDAF